MGDQIVIGIVVVVVVAAHLWLYRWVKFKIDEGAIIQFLKDASDQPFHSAAAIAAHTNMPIERVQVLCRRSTQIYLHAQGGDAWCLGNLPS
jgi:hypothetical protein